ncbi:arylamine N-acetyltransferase 1 [Penicillium angulare]|uniref:Arylamine N-acetyltransferase 1 n=1 Tax=Penicillium angulare TaxID=116970 RepID=A0A9W9GCX6_9EURO|nr:arylamine N-acetyltransferase 1 [Penicillium angulare]
MTISDLTADQVKRYFAHIELPDRFRSDKGPNLDFDFLASIQKHHITKIPYENIALHYNNIPYISLDVSDIYHKFVERGRGGYCMENNIFLHHVLRFLGFQVYLTGARLFRDSTSPNPGWSGWEHAVNIITLADRTQYIMDVGYGGDGPTAPLPLTADKVTPNIGTQELRLLYGTMPGLLEDQQNLWTYQFRNGIDQPWKSAYAFYEIQFFRSDFEIMNLYTSRSPSCFLTSKLLAIKFLRAEEDVFGKVILEGEKFKNNLGGKNWLMKTCQTEQERVEGLHEHFGISLTEEERAGILDKKSALPM